MSDFKLVKLPKALRRPLNGMCGIRLDKEDFIAAWYANNVLLFTKGESTARTVSVKETVQCVFNCETTVFCVGETGTIYSLSFVKNEDDVDIFDSSADEDELNCAPMITSFVPCIVVKCIVCISPLNSGFVILKCDLGKLYIEIYDSSNNSPISKTSAIELCSVGDMSVKQCTLKVYKASSMTPELQHQFVKTLCDENVSIVLVGLPTGSVFNIAVSSANGRILSPPALMYSCPYRVFSIVSLQNSQEKLFSKIGIVLTHGIIVIVSYDLIFGSLCYRVSNIPSYPQVIMEIGSSFFFGDGLDFWHCSLDKSGLSIDSKILNIKGVCFIANYCGEGNILIATVHDTYYTLLLEDSDLIPDINNPLPRYINVNEITQSLYNELLQIEELKREISCEENFISALGIFSRRHLFERLFSSAISIQKISCVSIEDFLSKYNCYNDIEEVLGGKQSLSDLYLFDIQVENKSELEFSPVIWSLHTEVKTNYVTNQKCEKLLRSFTSGSSISSSICVKIEQPFLGVTLSLSLITQLPEFGAPSSGMPWLTIPILVRDLDISHFIKNSISRLSSSDDIFTEKIVDLAQRMNPELSKLFTVNLKNSRALETYSCYEFHACHGSDINTLWLLIQEFCGCKRILGGSKTDSSDSIGNTFCVYIGKAKVEFIMTELNIQLSAGNPSLLRAFKRSIIDRWIFHSDSLQSIPLHTSIVARASLYKERMHIERMTCSTSEFTLLKKSWRSFVTEYLGV